MKSMTIRAKIITVFAIFLTSVVALTIFDWWSIVTIEQKVTVSEFFEDMFNNILEARRYEKNFLFYHDRRSLDENLVYINKAIDISTNMSKDIERVVGKEYQRFQLDLNDYKSMIETFVSRQDSIVTEKQDELIRLKGKAIGDFAEKLLSLKRQRIHLALAGILGLPFVFLAIFVVLSMLIAQLLFNRILKPLALVRRTIDRVALGDLSPIHYEENARDEISMLIYAFNRMAGELESKQEQLVQSRKIAAIGTFTAGIAHELNNPINNIYLTAESILEDYDTLSESEGKGTAFRCAEPGGTGRGYHQKSIGFFAKRDAFIYGTGHKGSDSKSAEAGQKPDHAFRDCGGDRHFSGYPQRSGQFSQSGAGFFKSFH